jgi:hypothetical protein
MLNFNQNRKQMEIQSDQASKWQAFKVKMAVVVSQTLLSSPIHVLTRGVA